MQRSGLDTKKQSHWLLKISCRQAKMDADIVLNEKLKIRDDIIAKKKMILDGHSVARITPAERMTAYDSVYTLCVQKPGGYSSLVYEKYTNCLRDRILEMVCDKLQQMAGSYDETDHSGA